jgi:uncharacterized protein YggE
MTATVSVRGRAAITAEPDEAQITIEIVGLKKSPEDALEDATERSAALEEIFRELGIEDGAIGTGGLSVGPQTEYDGKARRYVRRGYRAVNRIYVTLDDPQLVGKLLREATDRTAAEIQGPYWRLKLENPARSEANRLAMEDAKRKAETYVSALGARLGPIEAIREPGVSFEPRPRDTPPPAPMAAPAPSAVAAAPAIEVHTGTLEVTGAVEVSFLIEQD